MSQSNSNYERNSTRTKERLSKPPGDVEQQARKQEAKRGKQWSREDATRQRWDSNSVEF